MFFLDSTGFFSLVSLIIQAVTAWVFAAFFIALSSRSSLAVRHWRAAFLALGLGLTGVATRFLMAHQHVAQVQLVAEGTPLTRAFYALYFSGKCAFLWFLALGFGELCNHRWPRLRRVGVPLLLLAAALGASLPTIEAALLAQVPLCAMGFGYAAWASRTLAKGSHASGARITQVVALVWAAMWCLYGFSTITVGMAAPSHGSIWNVILQVSSSIDLCLQVALASGLIVVVMQAAQATVLATTRERDALREQVTRDEKLRALSTLVSGVAHEINNPLTAILGFAPDLTSDDKVLRDGAAHIVSEQAERCRGIVQRLATLGSPHASAREVLRLSSLVSRVTRGFGPQLTEAGLRLDTDLGIEQVFVFADATALEQVFANLLTNAIQASPRGESIEIRLTTTATTCEVAIEDRGPGVPGAERARIFEPFWTTKAPGVGTGLGLAVAHALVQAHLGSVAVADRPGGGARFVVSLPTCAEPEARPPAALRAAVPPPQGENLSVLVVDDEPLVRLAVARHADHYGWRAEEAESAESALRLLLDEGKAFDAVLCDLRMPGISGVGLHDHLAAHAPQVLRRVMFVTGDLTSQEAVAFAGRCHTAIIQKPLAMADVFARLRSLVASAETTPHAAT